MKEYVFITESALDVILTRRLFDEKGCIVSNRLIYTSLMDDRITFHITASDTINSLSAIIDKESLDSLVSQDQNFPFDVYNRIARLVKSLARPPIHLPRQWSEYHFKNMVTFFASPRGNGNSRWIVVNNSEKRNAYFESITDDSTAIDIKTYTPAPCPDFEDFFSACIEELKNTKTQHTENEASFAEKFDLSTIGSNSVVDEKNYSQWVSILTPDQMRVLEASVNSSVMISGPAGSGKTLTLCLRAIKLANEESVTSGEKKILFVTHSWAMAERIDSILTKLADGICPQNITVLPVFDALQHHTHRLGIRSSNVLSDDSEKGRRVAMDLIKLAITTELQSILVEQNAVSDWLKNSLQSFNKESFDLVFNLNEEFNGVIGGLGVALDDEESIKNYLSGSQREEWMPPFSKRSDRKIALTIYRRFIRLLWDRGVITTDQFILDSIRVLETFAWKMQREIDGYDFVFIDELQLFDTKERLAVELLSRAKDSTAFATAEDPSQGSFSTLYARKILGVHQNESIYLDSVHRFNDAIYELIKFFYQQSQLNSVQIRIESGKKRPGDRPAICHVESENADAKIANHIKLLYGKIKSTDCRLCIATIGEVSDNFAEILADKIAITQLSSFDDIEKLTYQKKTVTLSPWQYIGGTQFSHVVVVYSELTQNTAYGKLRQLISLYLSCSRASTQLAIICIDQIPAILQDAIEKGYLRVVEI